MTDAIHFPGLISAVLGATSALKGKTAPSPILPLLATELVQLPGALQLDDLPTVVREKVLAMISPLNSDLTRNDAKIALWGGTWQEKYPSQSEADLALCGHLARLGLSSIEIDQAFRASGLYRPKWEREDYRKSVIGLVLSPAEVVTATVSSAAPASDADSLWDIKNGKLFADQWRDKLLYVHEVNEWLSFDSSAGWTKSKPGESDRAAKDVVATIHALAAAMFKTEPDAKATKSQMAHFGYSSKAPSLEAMQRMAKSELGMTASVTDFDVDPLLLGVGNGVLDLKSQQLLPISPAIRVSKRCNVAFDAEATCPRFLRYLEEVQPELPIREFLQRFAGYCLTGAVGEKMFLMLLGTGDNGKTILVEVISWLLGTYATKIETEMLMEHKRNPQGASPDIVALKGMRFVFANETGEGQRLADARVKDLTGGDTLTGRIPYGKAAISFQPTHKLVVVGNHKPNISDTSSGMWSRVGLVSFDVVVPLEQRDRQLLEKLKAEGSGILNWMLEGCAAYQRQGLALPAKVNAATQAYRDEQDVVGEWRSEHCNMGPGLVCTKDDAYKAYAYWARAAGSGVLSKPRFTRRLCGAVVKQLPDKRTYSGIELNAAGKYAGRHGY
jgi:putative DNA primase/helicase